MTIEKRTIIALFFSALFDSRFKNLLKGVFPFSLSIDVCNCAATVEGYTFCGVPLIGAHFFI